MIHIIEKKFKGLVDWIHYWRNLPGKLELAKFEMEDVKSGFKLREESLNKEIKFLNSVIKQMESGDDDELLNRQLLEKYPTQTIAWNARSFPFSTIKCKVPVQVLITPNDPFIVNDLKEWGLYNTGEDFETLIPKIYMKIRTKYYKYQFDQVVWGSNEVWEFPFELREKGFTKGFDCDSWANFQVSYYRAAGMPAGMVWVVAGQTDLGGHSTVYVFSQKDNKFHHLNSTYGQFKTIISAFPTHQDAKKGKDKIGINKVWCSYNDICARSHFKDKIIGDLIIGKSKD